MQVEQEFFHRQEHAAVIAGRSQHHAVIPERLCHRFRHVAPAQVDDCDLFTQSLQLFCQIRRRFGSVAVNGSVCHQYALFLRRVAAPRLVQVQIGCEVAGQHRTVQRANGLYVQFCRLFQQGLYRCAVLAHNVEEIPPCFVCPRFVRAQCPELAKCVRGEQHLFGRLVGNHDFRPVHHRCHDKVQGVSAQFQHVPLLDGKGGVPGEIPEELGQHSESLCGAYQCHFRIAFRQSLNAAGVIRFHVGDHQIIRSRAVQHFRRLFQPLLRGTGVYGVQQSRLFVPNRVGIVGNAVGNGVLVFKQINRGVIYADVKNRTVRGNRFQHGNTSSKICTSLS